MIEVRIQKPTFLADSKCHIFKIDSEHLIEHTSATQIELPLQDSAVQTQVEPFYLAFLKAASGYFSKPLSLDVFQSRLVHDWNADEFMDSLELDGTTPLCFVWRPASIRFYTAKYEVQWVLFTVRRPPAPAPAAALPTPPTPPVTAMEAEQVPAAPVATVAPTRTPPPEGTIPFQHPATLEERRERMKQKVRKARLRALLAELRAERLAEKYYIRYGAESLEADTDSDLSYDSDNAPGKI